MNFSKATISNRQTASGSGDKSLAKRDGDRNPQMQWDVSSAQTNSSEAAMVAEHRQTVTVPATKLNHHTVPESSITKTNSTNWSPSLHTLLDEPPAAFPQRLAAGAILFSIVLGAWAWFGQVEEISQAQGQLVPKGKTYKIEPTELIKVEHIAVEEGQQVEAGQLLLQSNTELAQAEVQRLQQMQQAYQTELAQKQTLLEKLVLEAQASAAMATAEISAQQSAIALAKEKMTTLGQLLAQQQTEATAYQHKQTRVQPVTTLAQEQLSHLQAELKSRQQRLERLKPLAKSGAISQEYLFQAEQSLRETQKQINQTQVQEITQADEQIFQANQAMRELEARITRNHGELATAIQEVQRLQAELVRNQHQAEKTKLEAQQKIKQLEVELAQMNTKIADTGNLLATAETKLQQKTLVAPVAGIVYDLNIDNPGQVIQPGETALEIAPESAPLVLSAVIPVDRTGFVETGMPVQIKLDAYPYQDYGIVPGTVTAISPDAKSDEQLGEVYRIEVELERNYITDTQQQIRFKPGQTATADIVIRRRRILDVWLEPIKKLQQDGIKM